MQKIRREIVLYVACFAPRLAYVIWKMDAYRRSAFEYGNMSDDFLRTGQFQFTHSAHQTFVSAFMAPGVTWLLIVLKTLSPDHWPILIAILQLSLGVGLLWFLIRVGQSVLPSAKAVEVLAWLYILDFNLYIPLAWANETVYTMLFMVMGVYLVLKLTEDPLPNAWTALALGVCFACGSLFRAPLLVHFGVAMLWVAYGLWNRVSFKREVFLLGVACVGFCGTLSPWTYRNYRQFHQFIPVAQNLGMNLWTGWAPDAGGSEYGIGGRPLVMDPALQRETEAATSEGEINRILIDASIRYARENPRRWIRQRVYSFLFFWHEHNFWAPYSPFRTPLWRIVGFVNLLFVGLFFYAMIYAVRGRGDILLILSFLAVHSLIYTMIHADIGSRYRYQIEPLMLIAIVYGLMARKQTLVL